MIEDSDRRDSQLWATLLLSLLVLTAGIGAVFAPNIAWGIETIRLDLRYLPQLISGLVVLLVLLDVYVVAQRRVLRTTRRALWEQIARADDAVAESFIDPLTGIFNRRFMETALVREVKRADRVGGTFALVMIDIDDLSVVNNHCGHTAGDRLLKGVAQLLVRVFRQSDVVARYGGDEFLVILPDTDDSGARSAVDRLLADVATGGAAVRSDDPSMNLSCGVASYRAGQTIDEVIEVADRRMYSHKSGKTNRDRVDRVAAAPPRPA